MIQKRLMTPAEAEVHKAIGLNIIIQRSEEKQILNKVAELVEVVQDDERRRVVKERIALADQLLEKKRKEEHWQKIRMNILKR